MACGDNVLHNKNHVEQLGFDCPAACICHDDDLVMGSKHR